MFHTSRLVSLRPLGLIVFTLALGAQAQVAATHDPEQYGPLNGNFLADGLGLKVAIGNSKDTLLRADAPWTMVAWVKGSDAVAGRELVAGIGQTTSEYPRYLALEGGKVSLWLGEGNELTGSGPALATGSWHLIAATFDGVRFKLYSDGVPVGTGTLTMGSADPVLQMAPPVAIATAGQHFGGQVAGFTVLRRALTDAEMKQMENARPNFNLMEFEDGSKVWPLQTRQQAGYRAPQEPGTLPRSRGQIPAAVVKKQPPVGASLSPRGKDAWVLSDGWQMREAPKVNAEGEQVSAPGFVASGWMRATVPGTALTTLVDDGIYPDPDFGLNNLAIPESLNKQDYWFRNVFDAPAVEALGKDRHVEMTFEGINYAAAVWLNGKKLGQIKGAFTRGAFDVTEALLPGAENVLAVRVSPPPHPGLPQEESFAAGPGENGGAMTIDGPTFVATEGWDWIPTIRDRNTGIWQPVTLRVTHGVKLGDAQVVTQFVKHDTGRAQVEINVPVENMSAAPRQVTVEAHLEQVAVTKTVMAAPGETVVKLTASEFPQLMMEHPRLWWPNGYGSQEMYHLKLTVAQDGAVSDAKEVRFGVREISYELSLMDATGHLRRVEYFPTAARGGDKPVVDVSHAGMLEIPSVDAVALGVPEDKRNQYPYQSHVSSIVRGQENSPALVAMPVDGPAPYLVIKVNGVKIAARGGNWGMDDSRKRVSREHLEPFFRLHKEANLNIIRNWVGQDTEETFFELADEYGMLVWNDFWESTQNYNAEAEDPQLFLENAAEVIKRYRNHPSILLWCGRNEGVPQPILNSGLDKLTRELDGTRFYSPSSNQVNLQDSGPYSYQAPTKYFGELNRGFSVETGTPSLATLETLEAMLPKEDRWPINDVWAYHDWHPSGNGDVNSFVAEVQTEFGAATGIEDFERKAQMLNYVDYRAIFEGMNANLWAPNSGRMLWMTQPAWPSNHWNILSADYDTQGSFYGVKKACEPLHVQLNLATYGVDVVNTTREAQAGLTVTAKVYSLSNDLLFTGSEKKDVAADAKVGSLQLQLGGYLAKGMIVVQLTLTDTSGKEVSRNLYWLGARPASYRELDKLTAVPVALKVSQRTSGKVVTVQVEMTNNGNVVSLANKLTLLSGKVRALPAYYSDNYVSLLPGQTEVVEIETTVDALPGKAEVALRGWNTVGAVVGVK